MKLLQYFQYLFADCLGIGKVSSPPLLERQSIATTPSDTSSDEEGFSISQFIASHTQQSITMPQPRRRFNSE
jgi:hypothetical protein